MSIPTLTTERMVLRGWTEADAAPLYRIYCQEGVLRYFPKSDPPPREHTDKLIKSQLDRWDNDGYGLWAVDLKESGTLIGWCGLQFLPETDEIEVGYLLGRPYWGKGYATEAARASMNFAFETVGLTSIIAIVHPDNVASQRVIDKLGMTFVDENHYFGMDCYRYVKTKQHRLESLPHIERPIFGAVATALGPEGAQPPQRSEDRASASVE